MLPQTRSSNFDGRTHGLVGATRKRGRLNKGIWARPGDFGRIRGARQTMRRDGPRWWTCWIHGPSGDLPIHWTATPGYGTSTTCVVWSVSSSSAQCRSVHRGKNSEDENSFDWRAPAGANIEEFSARSRRKRIHDGSKFCVVARVESADRRVGSDEERAGERIG